MIENSASPQEKNNPSIVIERAVPQDAEAILLLKREARLDRYVNEEQGVTREDIYKKLSDEDIKTAIPLWQNGIANETDGGERTTYVARANEKVVGYTQPCIEEGQRRLGAMYVSPDAQGHGIGGQLINKALEWHGDNDVFLYVVSYNEAAIGFYEHFGFTKTGKELPAEYDEQTGVKLLQEFEMVHKAIA
jgi:GNAT superfamily N-acetyltransferase